MARDLPHIHSGMVECGQQFSYRKSRAIGESNHSITYIQGEPSLVDRGIGSPFSNGGARGCQWIKEKMMPRDPVAACGHRPDHLNNV